MKVQLERSAQKEREYQEIIRNLEQGVGGRMGRDGQREKDLGGIIEGIYKLFGEINCHLKKLLDPHNKSKTISTLDGIIKDEVAKVLPTTSVP